MHRRYDPVSVFLHWSIGLGILAIAVLELTRGELFAKGSAMREGLRAIHEPAGTIIFALVLVRLVWRALHAPPELPETMAAWERFAAKVMHVVLYALMVAIPVVGMAATFARGRPVDFGVFQIFVPLDGILGKSFARPIKELHEFLGQAVLAVAFLHAAAALWHHYVRKDDILVRMLPTRASVPR
ncbi:MAG TPA: cytochrome b [Hyphomicrobiaceae bacterium]|nr:cytochrome b [Hyphomicrobiaceae bacterium]